MASTQRILPDIDQRSAEILKAVVLMYLNKLQPVSSRKISKACGLSLSSATIRNIMADLEEYGFLDQPHTSAGRIPTDQAYRYFVENLTHEEVSLTPLEQQLIHNHFLVDRMSEEEIVQEIPKVISRLSSYIGVVVQPRYRNVRLKRIQFISVNEEQILTVIVSESGKVYQKLVPVMQRFSQEELSRMSHFVNSRFRGKTLQHIREQITTLLEEEQARYDRLLRNALDCSQQAFESLNRDDENLLIHMDGATNIFDIPDLADLEKMKKIFSAVLEKKHLIMLLNQFIDQDRVNVCIGSESHNEIFEDLSFVISPYKRGNETVGGIAVVGPTRMPYERMIALIDYLGKLVSSLLTSNEHEETHLD